MTGDLPFGRWTAVLIGPWWPAPSTTLRSGAQHWALWTTLKQELAENLRNQRMLLLQNQGKTAEDLIARYFQGEQSELDKAEKYKTKSEAFQSGADAIDYLRSRLTEISNVGNKQIDDILASKKPLIDKVTEIQVIQSQCNADAANASVTAVDKIVAATHKILQVESVGGDARSWAREHGFNVDNIPPPRQISQYDLSSPTVGEGVRDGGDSPGGTQSAGVRTTASGTGMRDGGCLDGPVGAQSAVAQAGPQPAAGAGARAGPLPAGPPLTGPASAIPPMIGAGLPAAPTMPGGGLSPTTAGQGISPASLGQSVATGMMTGQPAAAGAQSLSAGAMHAMDPGSASPAQTPAPLTPPTVAAPTMAAVGIESAAIHPAVDAAATPAGPPVMSTGDSGIASVTPAVVTGAPIPAAPAVSGPAVAAGPLPAYGADLRPPVVAPPAVPSIPAGPVSGAAVAPSVSSSPSAGGPLVSPVERSAASIASGQTASSSAMTGASAVSAATGATVGVVTTRAVEQQRLQRIVDAVARQESRLSWAAGLRDDGSTTLLVTDLAGG
ncbi:hypothetical protein LAUMK41_05682 [Mycobacterium attenuatum]|nr:hypothetical protein LAUMK41_05682 [Mycobacterium attenuatum]